MSYTTLYFGKHSDKTLPQIIFTDPDWFFYAYKEGYFDKRPNLLKEAEEIYRKASSIRIPQTGDEPKEIEYKFSPTNGKFMGCSLVPESRPDHVGSTATLRHSVIDMRLPSRMKGYDKLGNKIVVNFVKKLHFGDSSARITRERAESFFDNEDNFDFSLN